MSPNHPLNRSSCDHALPSACLRLTVFFLVAVASIGVAHADDGDPDPTFSDDGKASHVWPDAFVQAETTAVTTLADGSVVTVGWVDHGNDNRDFAIAKFRPDGPLDMSFGDQGTSVVAFDLEPGADDRAVGVFPAANGKLLVVGSAGVGPSPHQWPALLRLNPDGAPDASFGPDGKRVITSHPFGGGAKFQFRSAARAVDGKLLLAGACSSCGNGGLHDFFVLRLLPDGTPDPGFANAGFASFGRAADDHYIIEEASSVASDRQGRVLLAGFNETHQDPNEQKRPLFVRLTADGQLDTSFAGTGYLELNLLGSWDTAALAIDPVNDSMVAAINLEPTDSVVPATFLFRIRSTGVLDSTFGEDGVVDLTREEGSHITALAIRSDRRVTAAGWIDPNGPGNFDFYVARTLFDGTLDTSFDGNGVIRVAFDDEPNSYEIPHAMTLSGERPVIAGTLTMYGTTVVGFSTGVLRLKSNLIFTDGYE